MVDKRLVDEGNAKRALILKFLIDFARENEYAPSQGEVGAAVGLSNQAVSSHMRRMEREGLLRMGGRRIITVTDKGKQQNKTD